MGDASATHNVRAGLTRSESLLLSSLSGKGTTIFGLKDIVRLLKCNYPYAKVVANNLAKKKWIVVLKRGTYLIVPLSAGTESHYTEHEFVIASHLAAPYYIGYWSTLNFYRYTEQTPFTVFVATTKRAANRKILDIRYTFITLNRKKFFGFREAAVDAHHVNVSDPEKTLADALDHPEYCGGVGEVAKCLWNAKDAVSFDRLVEYAVRMENAAIVKRLGYLVETLRIDIESKFLSDWRKLISRGMSPLDPIMPRKGTYTTRWNLLVNVPKDTLEEWRRGF